MNTNKTTNMGGQVASASRRVRTAQRPAPRLSAPPNARATTSGSLGAGAAALAYYGGTRWASTALWQEKERSDRPASHERNRPGLETPQRRRPWHPQLG